MSQYDEIFIEGIKCYSTIGINNWEKNTKQPLIIDINLLMEKIDNNNKDNINETINYKLISYSVKELVEKNTYELIETMGKDIALLCLKNQKVVEAKVKINKPNALKISNNVGVVITRGKNEH
ncbi:MAG: dihydroneopterin aldolase [Dehalococcoidales bacterium]|nr:dihydroneopterin aldolase [Dehalococcoidales bacterium]